MMIDAYWLLCFSLQLPAAVAAQHYSALRMTGEFDKSFRTVLTGLTGLLCITMKM